MIDSAVIILTVLRDKEGFEIEDLKRLWSEIGDLSDSIVGGYATISDMKDVLKQEIWVLID